MVKHVFVKLRDIMTQKWTNLNYVTYLFTQMSCTIGRLVTSSVILRAYRLMADNSSNDNFNAYF